MAFFSEMDRGIEALSHWMMMRETETVRRRKWREEVRHDCVEEDRARAQKKKTKRYGSMSSTFFYSFWACMIPLPFGVRGVVIHASVVKW